MKNNRNVDAIHLSDWQATIGLVAWYHFGLGVNILLTFYHKATFKEAYK